MNCISAIHDTVKKNIRSYWNERSKTFDQDIGHGADEYECRLWKDNLTFIIGNTPKTILDVGTGTGMIAINLAELGHNVTGIDLCEDMLTIAKEKSESKNISIRFMLGDAENPEFPEGTFDVVICRHLLWTLPNPGKAILEWSRICGPGGTIIAIDGHIKPKDYFEYNPGLNESEMSERQKTWYRMYSPEITKYLPSGKDLTIDSLQLFFRSNGLCDVTFKNIPEITEYQNGILKKTGQKGEESEVNIIWGRVAE
jgi:ubiquinone/menaquinone biosynthesis C-methylase UbiE